MLKNKSSIFLKNYIKLSFVKECVIFELQFSNQEIVNIHAIWANLFRQPPTIILKPICRNEIPLMWNINHPKCLPFIMWRKRTQISAFKITKTTPEQLLPSAIYTLAPNSSRCLKIAHIVTCIEYNNICVRHKCCLVIHVSHNRKIIASPPFRWCVRE